MKSQFHVNSFGICINYGKLHNPFEDITHLEGYINYTIIHTVDGKKIVSSFTLKKFSDLIEKFYFCRTHKSYIVNLLHLKKYDSQTSDLMVLGNKNLKVSRRKKTELQSVLKSFKLEYLSV